MGLHWTMRLGDFSKFWLGPEVKVILQDPNDIEVKLCVFHSKKEESEKILFFCFVILHAWKFTDYFK